MSELKSGYGIVRYVGWRDEDDGSRRAFIATIEFPSGPPDLPIDVVWKQRPVVLSIAPKDHTGTDIPVEQREFLVTSDAKVFDMSR